MLPSPARISNDFFTRLLASLLLALSTFPVYLRTLAPGVYGFDSAELATGVFTQGLVHPPGNPLYLLIGKLFTFLPFGDVAYRLNIMSAVFASLTAVLLFWTIENIIEGRFAAWCAVFLFAFSNYFWQMALVAEVYTPLTALLAGDLLLVSLWHRRGLTKYLLAFSFLYGITLTMHTSAILIAPAFAWLILSTSYWTRSRWRLVGPMFVLFVIGLSPYLYLSIRADVHPAIDYSHIYGVDLTTASGLWWMVSGQAYSFFVFGYEWKDVPGEFMRFVSYLWRNYLGVGVILGLVGIAWLGRKSPSWLAGLLLAFAANVVFFVNYRVMDKDTMFLAAYLVWAVFVAGGLRAANHFLKRYQAQGWLDVKWGKAVSTLPILFILLAVGLNWRWVDMSRSTGYAAFAGEMMSEAEPDSMIIASWSSAVVLEYYQVVEGQRPDLVIFNRSRWRTAKYYEFWRQGMARNTILSQIDSEEVGLIDQYMKERTMYAVEYDPVLAQKFEYLPEGLAFRLAAQ
ncbi:hypothetical protein ANAEL_05545 [Anaerolineales bacterium]|nr:hypothetical protein ANAEL_05545 [Anaerolineales bacterium]